MENKYVGCGLYPENIDVKKHEDFRNTYYIKNGTINGIYINELVKSVENVIGVHSGKLEIVELMDTDTVSRLAHKRSPSNPHLFRENAKTDLKRVSINKIPKNIYNNIISFIETNYGTKYGAISHIVNEAMDLYLKLERGQVKLVEKVKKFDNKFINDINGQINFYDISNIYESIKELETQFNSIEHIIEAKVKSTFQSTLDLAPKYMGKVKKSFKRTINSFKRVDKFEKALKMLENLMKYKEFEFSDKDYHHSLVKLMGQGDMRTVHSDLAVLEADNRIKKLRNNSNGVSKYQFVNNNQYHKYNTEIARKKFLEGFREAFQNINALTINELNRFIFGLDGLYDAQSQFKRLQWLIDDGCVERHEANPRLLFITK